MLRGRYTPDSNKQIGETTNWILEEANDADVVAGLAKVAGDLILLHKTNGTKREWEA